MGRLANGWALTKQCGSVIRSDKELVVFPLLAGVGQLIVMVSFAAPFWAAGAFDSARGGITAGEIVALVAFYFASSFVIAFCGAALVGAALVRIGGGDPTVGDGFRMAAAHLPSILGWAAISATVGLILNLLSQRAGAAGRVASSVLGAGWGILTFLVIPLIVSEDLGPAAAVQRSGSLLKQTWGEQLTGRFAMGAIFGVMIFVVLLVGVAVVVLAAAASAVLAILLGVVFAFAVALLVLVMNAFNGVFSAAVYQFAKTGDAGPYFDAATISASLAPRGSAAARRTDSLLS